MTCFSPLGMESGHIPDQSIVASSRGSQYRGPERGRLNLQLTGNRESRIILFSLILINVCYFKPFYSLLSTGSKIL